jgi:hypothetical protein
MLRECIEDNRNQKGLQVDTYENKQNLRVDEIMDGQN